MASVNRGEAVAASAGRRPAGVVDHRVEPTRAQLHGAVHRRRGLVGIAQVGGHEAGRAAGGGHRGVGLVAGGDDHGGAQLEEALGDAPAHALGAARDQDHASGEVEWIGAGRHGPHAIGPSRAPGMTQDGMGSAEGAR